MQSISSWAPSCIGPYAQAVSANGLVHFAGQIGLDPPTMTLVPGGAKAQAMRCLRSCQAVSVAAKTDLQHLMLGCTIYAASAAPSTALADNSEACQQSSSAQAAEPSQLVNQTFSHVQQLLTAFEKDGLPLSATPDADIEPSHCQQHDSSHGLGASQQAPVPRASAEAGSGDEEDKGEEEPFVDEYLRALKFETCVRPPLLTYVEALALPKGAAVELQPLALHSSWPQGSCPGALPLLPAEGWLAVRIPPCSTQGSIVCNLAQEVQCI